MRNNMENYLDKIEKKFFQGMLPIINGILIKDEYIKININ
jgi:hypothetical protein